MNLVNLIKLYLLNTKTFSEDNLEKWSDSFKLFKKIF